MPLLDTLPAATLQANLAAALDALNKLTLGQSVVTVSYGQGDGSKMVTYRAAKLPELRAYIHELRRALGMPSGRRAVGVRFCR